MPIPDYQALLAPILHELSDGEPRPLAQIRAQVARRLGLSDEDLREMVPSGQKPLFHDRVSWAISYLKQAEVLEAAQAGGLRAVAQGLRGSGAAPGANRQRCAPPVPGVPRFPGPLVAEAGRAGRAGGGHERRDAGGVARIGGSLEDAGRAIGRSRDGGIDGIIKEDRLGLDVIHVQAKRWNDRTVGRPDLQAFAGSLEGVRARKGIFITTSSFSADALDYVDRIDKRIVLVDGKQLAAFMYEYGIGVTPTASYAVKRIDSDFFGEE